MFNEEVGKKLNDLLQKFFDKENMVSYDTAMTIVAVLLSVASRIHMLASDYDIDNFIDAASLTYKEAKGQDKNKKIKKADLN